MTVQFKESAGNFSFLTFCDYFDKNCDYFKKRSSSVGIRDPLGYSCSPEAAILADFVLSEF